MSHKHSFLLVLLLQGCPEPKEGEDSAAEDTNADVDDDGYGAKVDCDDGSPAISPGAEERCNGKDDDCDGETDEMGSVDGNLRYVDSDGDGVGGTGTVVVCADSVGTSTLPGDCDDTDAAVSPLADERCDDQDNNCDGRVDEPGAEDGELLPIDRDEDGFGHPALTGLACGPGEGFAENTTDCDDSDPARNPDAAENCTNEVDDDCDGVTDETDDAHTPIWYADDDDDGYGGAEFSISQCAPVPGYTAQGNDCDDDDEDIHPGQPDGTDDVDNDCDGEIDELGDSVGSGTLILQKDGRNGCEVAWDTTWEELSPEHRGDLTWRVEHEYDSRASDDPEDCVWTYGTSSFSLNIAFFWDTMTSTAQSVMSQSGDSGPYLPFGLAELHYDPATLEFSNEVLLHDGTSATLTGSVRFEGL